MPTSLVTPGPGAASEQGTGEPQEVPQSEVATEEAGGPWWQVLKPAGLYALGLTLLTGGLVAWFWRGKEPRTV